jgi:CubicO group peptidase (beta-lactamase class C family)
MDNTMPSIAHNRFVRLIFCLLIVSSTYASGQGATHVAISGTQWLINGLPTHPGTATEGLLMNVRMVNATFEDTHKSDFDPEANSDRFIAAIPSYAAHGIDAFTLCLQGGMPGYEGAKNSAFEADGELRNSYMQRVERVIRACDAQGVAVILGLYYQRQSKILRDETSVRQGVINVAQWVQTKGFSNVLLEIANEYPHQGFAHHLIRDPHGQAELIRLAKQTSPNLLVTASGYGDGKVDPQVAHACDFLTPHWNGTKIEQIASRVQTLQHFGKPIVCNEDDKTGDQAVAAMQATVSSGASYGLMLQAHNQTFPFRFDGAADDPLFYAALKSLTSSPVQKSAELPSSEFERVTTTPTPFDTEYFPPAESQGGWRMVKSEEEIESLGGMDRQKIAELQQWLLQSDKRPFAAVVIRNGIIVLQVERGNSAISDARRVASVSKAICATVLAIASEQSQQGNCPHTMSFDDKAFDFIPWAAPLSDPRKSQITIRQLLNHTSGICPEAIGAANDGSWEYVLGLSGDKRTEQLAFDPGKGCGYSTHALAHASLVCETVTGKPYDQFAIEALFEPLGIEHWTFQYYDGGEQIGRHPSHGIGMPARDLARIGYCMLHQGRWHETQVIPQWFVEQTGSPTSDVSSPEMRWQLNPQVFSHGWELPARHDPDSGRDGAGIPADARAKPGSGGQLLAFVPSLDLVIARQTGGSGPWDYEEFLRLACAAVQPKP